MDDLLRIARHGRGHNVYLIRFYIETSRLLPALMTTATDFIKSVFFVQFIPLYIAGSLFSPLLRIAGGMPSWSVLPLSVA